MDKFIKYGRLRKLGFVLIVVIFSFSPINDTIASDCSVSFTWVPNSESNLTGYKIYYGQSSGGPYPDFANIGQLVPENGNITGTVAGLTCGQQYYFVCVAVNDAGGESQFSDEIVIIANTDMANLPGVPENLIIIE